MKKLNFESKIGWQRDILALHDKTRLTNRIHKHMTSYWSQGWWIRFADLPPASGLIQLVDPLIAQPCIYVLVFFHQDGPFKTSSDQRVKEPVEQKMKRNWDRPKFYWIFFLLLPKWNFFLLLVGIRWSPSFPTWTCTSASRPSGPGISASWWRTAPSWWKLGG